jgi:hypothetical protein
MLKKTLLTLIIFTLATTLFALPGFTSFVPDTAGEYVWYRDNSFARESYVGLLNYDDTSYQIRYYAPASRTLGQPAKDIALLFTVNPESDFFDMTGEKIISEIDAASEDDLDILNYLHDILYEFSARRIKAGEIAATPVSLSQEYEQFGGKVTINFDSLIPLFNIKNIKAPDGSLLFSCVTFGRIISGEDTSFEDFHGLLAAKPYHAPSKKKIKGKSAKFTTQDGQEITLDTNWQSAADNMWMFGEEAFLTIATIPVYFEDKALNDLFVLRRITESTGGSYTDFENIEISVDSKKYITKVTARSSQPENNRIVYVIKELTTDPSKDINSYVSLAAWEDSYLDKSNYYTKILKTFKD